LDSRLQEFGIGRIFGQDKKGSQFGRRAIAVVETRKKQG
jgi:hypothetical protein